MSGLNRLGLIEARELLRRRAISAVELTQSCLAAMERGRRLNAFITETPEKALAMAQAADARLARGEGGLLEGLPIAVKDLFCTAGVRTTAASRMLANFVPFYESTVTAKLWAEGAVLLGKTNLDEFAMGSSNTTSAFGPVINPWTPPGASPGLVPGGSSGGSAAAVAAFLCPLPPAPTPAARSASQRVFAASSGSNRPMGAARAGASSPLRARSIRPAPSPAPSRMRRYSCRR